MRGGIICSRPAPALLSLPVLVGCARACVRAFAIQRLSRFRSGLRCDSNPESSERFGIFFLPGRLVSPFVIIRWGHGSRRHGVVRSACAAGRRPPAAPSASRQASSDAEAESGRLILTASGGGRWRRGGWGWGPAGETRARDRGHVRRGGCGRRDGSTPSSPSPPAGRVPSSPSCRSRPAARFVFGKIGFLPSKESTFRYIPSKNLM